MAAGPAPLTGSASESLPSSNQSNLSPFPKEVRSTGAQRRVLGRDKHSIDEDDDGEDDEGSHTDSDTDVRRAARKPMSRARSHTQTSDLAAFLMSTGPEDDAPGLPKALRQGRSPSIGDTNSVSNSTKKGSAFSFSHLRKKSSKALGRNKRSENGHSDPSESAYRTGEKAHTDLNVPKGTIRKTLPNGRSYYTLDVKMYEREEGKSTRSDPSSSLSGTSDVFLQSRSNKEKGTEGADKAASQPSGAVAATVASKLVSRLDINPVNRMASTHRTPVATEASPPPLPTPPASDSMHKNQSPISKLAPAHQDSLSLSPRRVNQGSPQDQPELRRPSLPHSSMSTPPTAMATRSASSSSSMHGRWRDTIAARNLSSMGSMDEHSSSVLPPSSPKSPTRIPRKPVDRSVLEHIPTSAKPLARITAAAGGWPSSPADRVRLDRAFLSQDSSAPSEISVASSSATQGESIEDPKGPSHRADTSSGMGNGVQVANESDELLQRQGSSSMTREMYQTAQTSTPTASEERERAEMRESCDDGSRRTSSETASTVELAFATKINLDRLQDQPSSPATITDGDGESFAMADTGSESHSIPFVRRVARSHETGFTGGATSAEERAKTPTNEPFFTSDDVFARAQAERRRNREQAQIQLKSATLPVSAFSSTESDIQGGKIDDTDDEEGTTEKATKNPHENVRTRSSIVTTPQTQEESNDADKGSLGSHSSKEKLLAEIDRLQNKAWLAESSARAEKVQCRQLAKRCIAMLDRQRSVPETEGQKRQLQAFNIDSASTLPPHINHEDRVRKLLHDLKDFVGDSSPGQNNSSPESSPRKLRESLMLARSRPSSGVPIISSPTARSMKSLSIRTSHSFPRSMTSSVASDGENPMKADQKSNPGSAAVVAEGEPDTSTFDVGQLSAKALGPTLRPPARSSDGALLVASNAAANLPPRPASLSSHRQPDVPLRNPLRELGPALNKSGPPVASLQVEEKKIDHAAAFVPLSVDDDSSSPLLNSPAPTHSSSVSEQQPLMTADDGNGLDFEADDTTANVATFAHISSSPSSPTHSRSHSRGPSSVSSSYSQDSTMTKSMEPDAAASSSLSPAASEMETKEGGRPFVDMEISPGGDTSTKDLEVNQGAPHADLSIPAS